VLLRRVPSSSSPSKGLYNPKAFITHAASLDQACAHCPRFPTAASRRSLGRVSVPVWLIVLSDQLPIRALVGRYPTNQLIGRGPLPGRPAEAGLWPLSRRASSGISRSFPRLSRCPGQVPTRYAPVRHYPRAETRGPFDLHVLGAPPAFVLSQDQTLSLVPRRPRSGLTRRAFGSTASLHKAGPQGIAPKGRSPAGLPRQALKGDRLEAPRPAPPRAPAGARSGLCPIAAPQARPRPHRRADLAPPPYRCLSPRPIQPPPTHPFLFSTCPKTNPAPSATPSRLALPANAAL
jgi:hypothetical protein